jgi:hypothetical protein
MVSVLSVATIFQSVNVATPERYGSFERLCALRISALNDGSAVNAEPRGAQCSLRRDRRQKPGHKDHKNQIEIKKYLCLLSFVWAM